MQNRIFHYLFLFDKFYNSFTDFIIFIGQYDPIVNDINNYHCIYDLSLTLQVLPGISVPYELQN